MAVIWGNREAECFSREDWTSGIALMWLKKLVCGHESAADRMTASGAKLVGKISLLAKGRSDRRALRRRQYDLPVRAAT
jgi:hypothetical protein